MAAFCLLTPSGVLSEDKPTVVFSEGGIYLSANPDARAQLGETLSLTNLGRTFKSCRVGSEYYSGDEETIVTALTCDGVIVWIYPNESGEINGFWRAPRSPTTFRSGIRSSTRSATPPIATCERKTTALTANRMRAASSATTWVIQTMAASWLTSNRVRAVGAFIESGGALR